MPTPKLTSRPYENGINGVKVMNPRRVGEGGVSTIMNFVDATVSGSNPSSDTRIVQYGSPVALTGSKPTLWYSTKTVYAMVTPIGMTCSAAVSKSEWPFGISVVTMIGVTFYGPAGKITMSNTLDYVSVGFWTSNENGWYNSADGGVNTISCSPMFAYCASGTEPQPVTAVGLTVSIPRTVSVGWSARICLLWEE